MKENTRRGCHSTLAYILKNDKGKRKERKKNDKGKERKKKLTN